MKKQSAQTIAVKIQMNTGALVVASQNKTTCERPVAPDAATVEVGR
jgi:hypothetical protein